MKHVSKNKLNDLLYGVSYLDNNRRKSLMISYLTDLRLVSVANDPIFGIKETKSSFPRRHSRRIRLRIQRQTRIVISSNITFSVSTSNLSHNFPVLHATPESLGKTDQHRDSTMDVAHKRYVIPGAGRKSGAQGQTVFSTAYPVYTISSQCMKFFLSKSTFSYKDEISRSLLLCKEWT